MTTDGTSRRTLRSRREGGVLTLTLDNPPVNVLSAALMIELLDALAEARSDPTLRVIVIDSANAEFFSAHVDMHILDDPEGLAELGRRAPDGVNVFQLLAVTLRAQPQLTIVKLRGIARGGGAELVAAADLALAAIETARLGQVEALMGIVPGGGGTQLLREKVGRNRALELVLTGDSVDAETAAVYGWINRAVPAVELDPVVDRIAREIASLPDGVIEAAKRAVPPSDLADGLRVEDAAWAGLVERPAARQLMADALDAGAQTIEGEREIEEVMRSVRR